MASNPLLALSVKGVLRGVAERLNQKFAYYLTSEASQNPVYAAGTTRSFQKSIQLYGNNAASLKTQIEQDLTAIYQGLFDDISVTVTIGETASDGTNRYDIQIDVLVSEQGVTYSAGREMLTINGVVQNLVALLNGTFQ